MEFLHEIVLSSVYLEYKILALTIVLIIVLSKYGNKRYIEWIAFPLALIYIFFESIIGFLRGLQIKVLRNRLQNGTRWEVMIIFIITGFFGLVSSILAKVFGVAGTTAPFPLLPLSFLSSILSKYFNFVLLPEIMEHGKEKLNSFKYYNKVYLYLNEKVRLFKATKIFAKIQIIGSKLKDVMISTKSVLLEKMEVFRPYLDKIKLKTKQQKTIFSEFIRYFKINLRLLRKKFRSRQ